MSSGAKCPFAAVRGARTTAGARSKGGWRPAVWGRYGGRFILMAWYRAGADRISDKAMSLDRCNLA